MFRFGKMASTMVVDASVPLRVPVDFLQNICKMFYWEAEAELWYKVEENKNQGHCHFICHS